MVARLVYKMADLMADWRIAQTAPQLGQSLVEKLVQRWAVPKEEQMVEPWVSLTVLQMVGQKVVLMGVLMVVQREKKTAVQMAQPTVASMVVPKATWKAEKKETPTAVPTAAP